MAYSFKCCYWLTKNRSKKNAIYGDSCDSEIDRPNHKI